MSKQKKTAKRKGVDAPAPQPTLYPFYVIPPVQCPECESGVRWETQKLDPTARNNVAYGSCLSGSVGVRCSRAGKRFAIPLMIAWAVEVAPPAYTEVRDPPPAVEPAKPAPKPSWFQRLMSLFDGTSIPRVEPVPEYGG